MSVVSFLELLKFGILYMLNPSHGVLVLTTLKQVMLTGT